jgi:proteasome alpha subunit
MTMPFYVPPEQLMKDRAEYARKGIARGKSIVGVEYADGMLLLGENPSGTLQKISEVYDRIAFAGVGKYTEFEQLRIGGIRRADLTGYAYSRIDVTAKSLANAYAQTLGHVFTQEVKPFEVEVMVVEIGDDHETSRIYRVTYDGTLHEEPRAGVPAGSAADGGLGLGEGGLCERHRRRPRRLGGRPARPDVGKASIPPADRRGDRRGLGDTVSWNRSPRHRYPPTHGGFGTPTDLTRQVR